MYNDNTHMHSTNLFLPKEWSIYDFMVKKAFSRSMPLFEFVEDDTGVEIDSVIYNDYF